MLRANHRAACPWPETAMTQDAMGVEDADIHPIPRAALLFLESARVC